MDLNAKYILQDTLSLMSLNRLKDSCHPPSFSIRVRVVWLCVYYNHIVVNIQVFLLPSNHTK